MVAPADHKQEALRFLRDLRASIQTHSGLEGADQLLELVGHLERAIETFHMEAIRFRMFTIGRRLAQTPGLGPEALAHFERVRGALEAAGFHTRSVSN